MNKLVRIFVAEEWSWNVLKYAVDAFEAGLRGKGISISLNKLDGVPVVIFGNEDGKLMNYDTYTERFSALCEGLQSVENDNLRDTL